MESGTEQNRTQGAESDLKKMQQRLVDGTLEDSFPASDPPAWTTTGAKSVAGRCDEEHQQASSSTDDLYTQARQTAGQIAGQAAGLAQEVYRRGEQYLEAGRRRLPEAERYYREGREAVSRSVGEYPVAALLVAGAVGYGIAWLVYGRSTHSDWDGRRMRARDGRDLMRRERAARMG